jgi:Fe-Mn family superoxide dismutase
MEDFMEFKLHELPYAKNALEPRISARTVEVHYEKHHRGYLNKLQKAIEGQPMASKSLEEIIRTSEGWLFNNAAQLWNHTFYWNSLTPKGGGAPSAGTLSAVEKSFGSLDEFKRKFAEVANGQFGSGWAWLAADAQGSLSILATSNADSPLKRDTLIPILVVDVWEHAYYLDYQNDRNSYTEACVDHLLNWEFAARNLEAVKSTVGA